MFLFVTNLYLLAVGVPSVCTREGLQAVPVRGPDVGGGEGGVPLRRPTCPNQFGARCLQRGKLISILLHKY